ncbi:MAG: flagellar hook protein FlgE [Pseudomonadales bacterium]|nr:flagellar hook protein FlgE [Pseudomonadales bacterium]
MAFNTAISGLRAASSDLNVIGNNIANASTTGFKGSVAEFADVYASSVVGGGGNSVGSGVLLADVAQQFSQGNISFTNNALDLAINGTGFFITSAQGEKGYTRSGLFSLDRDGFIVNNSGANLQGFLTTGSGGLDSDLSNLQIQTGNLEPIRTTEIKSLLNLDASALPPATTPFDAQNTDTFNNSTSVSVFDSQGNSHVMTQYFVKEAALNTWTMHVKIDDEDVGAGSPATLQSYTLVFNDDGTLSTTQPLAAVTNWTPVNESGNPNGSAVGDAALTSFPFPDPLTSSNFVINLTGTTQFGGSFSVNDLTQNGFAQGRLAGIDIASDGSLFARYTNGQSRSLGKVALAAFNNEQGLSPQGNSAWAETFESGSPKVGVPATAALGVIQSGALEDSNVELSEELVALIVAQRNFQANAKTIETESAVTQSIISLR